MMVSAATQVAPLFADGAFDHMDGWGWFWMVMWVPVVALAVAAVIGASSGRRRADRQTSSRAIDILDERYARGEIDRDEYLERRHQIET